MKPVLLLTFLLLSLLVFSNILTHFFTFLHLCLCIMEHDVDLLKFAYNGNNVVLLGGSLSQRTASEQKIKVVRAMELGG